MHAFEWLVAKIVAAIATLVGLFNALIWSTVVLGGLLLLAFGYLAMQE